MRNQSARIITTDAAAPAAPKCWKVSTAGRSMDILSKQWFARPADERYLSLDDLRDHTKAQADRASQVTISSKKLEVISAEILPSDSREVAMQKSRALMFGMPDGREVSPTNWAFGQIAQLAGAPAPYLRRMPSPIVADALRYNLRYERGEDEVKLYADDLEAMAITGPDYGRIFNYEVAEAVASATYGATGDHRWKIPGLLDWSTGIYDPHAPVTKDTTTLFANDKGVFIFLCQDLAPIDIGKLPSGEPDLVFRGFYVTNSEVGAGALKLGGMYLRAICKNRILWGVENFQELTMRHSKYAPDRFIQEAQPALQSFAEGSTAKLLEGVHKARESVVADNKDAALDWLKERGIARKRAQAVYDAIVKEEWQGEEDDARPIDAWTMAQGMTATAREESNFDTRMELEVQAGKLLDKVA